MSGFSLRSFRNTDPPGLVRVWRGQPVERGVTKYIDVARLEHFVLAKPWFDRHGLIVAEHDDQVVGFVHAGFGPNVARDDLQVNDGVICMLQILPEFESTELLSQLRVAAEEYLAGRGSRHILGGPHPPYVPFYHGLCESSELPGVLSEDHSMHEMYKASGYDVAERFAVMNCQLRRMRPLVDRNQRQLLRSFEVRPTLDHRFDNWWTRAPTDRFNAVSSKLLPKPTTSFVVR